MPSFNERKAPALVGNISTVVVVGPFVGMPGEIIPKEVFLWLTTIPSVAVDCMSICRYIDEYVSFEVLLYIYVQNKSTLASLLVYHSRFLYGISQLIYWLINKPKQLIKKHGLSEQRSSAQIKYM